MGASAPARAQASATLVAREKPGASRLLTSDSRSQPRVGESSSRSGSPASRRAVTRVASYNFV